MVFGPGGPRGLLAYSGRPVVNSEASPSKAFCAPSAGGRRFTCYSLFGRKNRQIAAFPGLGVAEKAFIFSSFGRIIPMRNI